ncbi:MAG: ribosomal protein L22/L17 [Benniella sp.]|nr:MAG: ribosomal protein L22/L17 [Benniella sp.]
MLGALKSAFRAPQPVSSLKSLVQTTPRGFHAVAIRLAEQKSTMKPVKPELGASSLFGDIASHVKEVPVEQGGKPKVKEYHFSTADFKTSTKKLRLLANQIKGLDIQNAINQMEFSQKRPSKRVMNTLAFARTNATTQEKYAMDASKLYVDRAWVGKGVYHRRIKIHARGKFGVMHHPTAHLKFTLKERQPEENEEGRAKRRNIRGWKRTKKVWMPLIEDKPVYNPSHLYNW